jgi:putative transposase
MDNHVHLLALPERTESLSKALGRAHSEYARYFNIRYGKCGHLWEARYFSCPLGGSHIWAALRYVERNPVQAGMVREPHDWRWSSARAHIAGEDPGGFLAMDSWREMYDGETWQMELAPRPQDEVARLQLRAATMRGRPLGSKAFVDRLEHDLGRRLTARRAGRPAKKVAENPAVGVQMEIGN